MNEPPSTSRAAMSCGYCAAEPLWQLAPVRDPQGQPVADFMLLIPRLRERGPAFSGHAVQALRRVCRQFGERVHFADLNLRTGAIWVSVAAQPGLCGEVADAIRRELPQALTVGGQLGALNGGLVAFPGVRRGLMWFSRIRRRVVRRLLPSPRGNATR